VGVGEHETFIASAIPAFLQYTRHVGIVGDDELVVVRPEGVEFLDAVSGEPVTREITEVDWDDDAAEKSGY
jgi:glucosamine--fructose-6-phosphate aminotransferase (isomerizing)